MIRYPKKIIETAAYILSKDYIDLTDNRYNNKNFIGVNTKSGVNYSSLSMGTGEQRIIKILRTVFSAKKYSLILIDEIDLLLHIDALKKLIFVLKERAEKDSLQIVFTTHSLEIPKMGEHVLIQYIQKINYYPEMITCVYNRLTDDLIVDLSGESSKPIKIYVEDSFSEAIAHYVCRKKDIVEKVEIIKIGSIENSFTLASGLILEKKDCSNMAVLLDGDKYTTDDEKEDRLKKMISGTDLDAEENRKNAKKIIIQYDSPNQLSPEEFLYSLIVDLSKENIQSDIIKMALKINSVVDKHEYINIIKKRLELSDREIVNDIAILLTNCEKWNKYICPLEEWLEQRRDL